MINRVEEISTKTKKDWHPLSNDDHNLQSDYDNIKLSKNNTKQKKYINNNFLPIKIFHKLWYYMKLRVFW